VLVLFASSRRPRDLTTVDPSAAEDTLLAVLNGG
jgi:hypothetical protein